MTNFCFKKLFLKLCSDLVTWFMYMYWYGLIWRTPSSQKRRMIDIKLLLAGTSKISSLLVLEQNKIFITSDEKKNKDLQTLIKNFRVPDCKTFCRGSQWTRYYVQTLMHELITLGVWPLASLDKTSLVAMEGDWRSKRLWGRIPALHTSWIFFHIYCT